MKRIGFHLWLAQVRLHHWWHDVLPWWIAWKLPPRVALFAFVRVYGIIGDIGPDYRTIYRMWEEKHVKQVPNRRADESKARK